jgi:hypothetical protein
MDATSDTGLVGVVACVTEDAGVETADALWLRARRTWIAAAPPSLRW